jgi:exonuclease III
VVVGDFNTPLSLIDRSSKQKINKETLELNDTLNQMDLTFVYRIFHPTKAQYTFFSVTQGIFSKIDHILGHNTSLRKHKRKEIPPAFYLITMH